MSAYKPILCIDFDGVIHSYEKGWQDGEIYGTATPGFFAWALKAYHSFRLVIYSSRSSTEEGLRAMREAIGKWSVEAINSGEIPGDTDWSAFFPALEFASTKPPAFLTIDDRAVRFDGSWEHLSPASLLAFKSWTQKAGQLTNKYRIKLPTVEAMRWTGNNTREVTEWAQPGIEPYGMPPGWWLKQPEAGGFFLVIEDGDTEWTAKKGDWVILTPASGEFMTMTPEGFAETFEPIA